MDGPAVTVIVATYNCRAVLACALQSLLAQTFRDFEAIVVGDACTDGSGEVVAALGDPRLRWINLPSRHGSQYGPNNAGLALAKGKYVAYLGHDDLWFPWHLETLVAEIVAREAGLVHAAIAYLYPKGPVRIGGAPDIGRSYTRRFVPPTGWMHKTEIVPLCGGWQSPDHLHVGVDFEIQRRIARAGYLICGTGKLSAIKLHSAAWHTYARTQNLPQTEYLEAMRTDPRTLERMLLQSVALEAGRLEDNPRLHDALRLLVRLCRRALFDFTDWYGRDRWPLRPYLIWARQRSLQRMLPLRGLDDQTQSKCQDGPALSPIA